MYYVICGINQTKLELFIEKNEELLNSVNQPDYIGHTPQIRHWDCRKDAIVWELLAQIERKDEAIKLVEDLKEKYSQPGFKIICANGKLLKSSET